MTEKTLTGKVAGGELLDDGTTLVMVQVPGRVPLRMSIPAIVVLDPEPARALAAAPGGAEIELTPAGREARDDPAEREAQGNFVSGPWCNETPETPPDEALRCTRRPDHDGDHVAAGARLRRPRLILARWPSAPASPSVAPGQPAEREE
jgi:hypothetical protein